MVDSVKKISVAKLRTERGSEGVRESCSPNVECFMLMVRSRPIQMLIGKLTICGEFDLLQSRSSARLQRRFGAWCLGALVGALPCLGR